MCVFIKIITMHPTCYFIGYLNFTLPKLELCCVEYGAIYWTDYGFLDFLSETGARWVTNAWLLAKGKTLQKHFLLLLISLCSPYCQAPIHNIRSVHGRHGKTLTTFRESKDTQNFWQHLTTNTNNCFSKLCMQFKKWNVESSTYYIRLGLVQI